MNGLATSEVAINFQQYDAWIASLSARVRNCLSNEGFRTREQVRVAFQADGGRTLSARVPNLGRRSVNEIAARLKDELPDADKQQSIETAIVLLTNNGYLVTKEKP